MKAELCLPALHILSCKRTYTTPWRYIACAALLWRLNTTWLPVYHLLFVLYFTHYHHHPWLLTTTRENSRLAKYQEYIINSNHKSMQLELLYDQTPSSFLDDFRKLVQSHPEVQLAAVQDISSPSSSQATASGTGSPSSSQATASDTGSPSSSQATAPPPAKKSKKGYPARVKHSRSYCTNCYSSNSYFIDPSGYEKDNPPVLDGPNACPHCHLSPCVVARPPSWLRGSCDASLSNISKRFKLTEDFGRY